jgi:hypothetical protein
VFAAAFAIAGRGRRATAVNDTLIARTVVALAGVTDGVATAGDRQVARRPIGRKMAALFIAVAAACALALAMTDVLMTLLVTVSVVLADPRGSAGVAASSRPPASGGLACVGECAPARSSRSRPRRRPVGGALRRRAAGFLPPRRSARSISPRSAATSHECAQAADTVLPARLVLSPAHDATSGWDSRSSWRPCAAFRCWRAVSLGAAPAIFTAAFYLSIGRPTVFFLCAAAAAHRVRLCRGRRSCDCDGRHAPGSARTRSPPW